jgi:hypothetical protein
VIEGWSFEYNTRRLLIPRWAIGRRRHSQFDQEKIRLWTLRMQYKLSHSAWYKKSVRSVTPARSESKNA